jgi:biotin carboxyl carrier protein
MIDRMDIVAPLSGRVIEIMVRTGDRVRKDQVVAVLEAMKMDNELIAEADGVVSSVNVSEGEFISFGTSLITLEKI